MSEPLVRGRQFVVIFFVLAGLSPVFSARAVEVLDAHAQPSDPNVHFFYSVGVTGTTVARDVSQTFTPTVSGLLSRMGIQAFAMGSPTLPLKVEVRSAPGGVVDQFNSLAQVLVNASTLPGDPGFGPFPFTYVDFSAFNIPVNAGQQYALVLRSDQPFQFPTNSVGYNWYASDQGENIYSGGTARARNGGSTDVWSAGADNDLSFQEYVTIIPEPSTFALLTLGGVIAFAAKRRAV